MKKILAALITLSMALGIACNVEAEKSSKQVNKEQVYFMADPGGSVG